MIMPNQRAKDKKQLNIRIRDVEIEAVRELANLTGLSITDYLRTLFIQDARRLGVEIKKTPKKQ